MERYVWELSHALAARGVEVVILCEKAYGSPAPDLPIRVICLGETRPKPRWISMLRFSRRVTHAVNAHGLTSDNGWVIHSHERTGVHQVTTFHGPPMAPIRQKKPLWWTSPRLICWLWLERRELGRSGVTVLPNSLKIAELLRAHYPVCRMGRTMWPGVSVSTKSDQAPKSDFVFIGKEHHRKGLDRVIAAIELLRSDNLLTLTVIGAEDNDELSSLLSGRAWVNYVPWLDSISPSEWGRVLVLPARNEPYGMVVAEAVASGINAVVSEVVGAADHYETIVWCQIEGIQSLADAMLASLVAPVSPQKLHLWSNVGEEHAHLYRHL